MADNYGNFFIYGHLAIKGKVDVIITGSSAKELHARFTTIPLIILSE